MKCRYRLQKLVVSYPDQRLGVWKETNITSHTASLLDNFLTHGYRIFDAEFNQVIKSTNPYPYIEIQRYILIYLMYYFIFSV